MPNIHCLRTRLMLIRRKECKSMKAELYMEEHNSGMSYAAIGRKYGVTRQAVFDSITKYRRRMEKEKKIWSIRLCTPSPTS